MKLKEAIEKLNNLIKNANVEDIDMNDIFGGEHIEAIDTVLEELNNRIPVKVVKEEINELEEHKMDIVNSLVHNANEKLRMISRNNTKIETLQDLLKKIGKLEDKE